MAEQFNLFGRQAPPPSRAIRRGLPPRPMVVDDFRFDGSDPRLVPQPGVVIPEHLKLPTDDPDWMPEKG